MKKTTLTLLFLTVIILTGCANPYKDYYTQTLDLNELSKNDKQHLVFLKEGQEPVLIRVSDPKQADYDAAAKGYVQLGVSCFVGPEKDIDLLKSQAKDIKATHVLYQIVYSDTRSGTTSIAVPNYQVTTAQGTVVNSYGRNANFYGTSTTTGTDYIPVTYHIDRYKQDAAYYVKDTKKYRFGLLIDQLTQEQRAKIGQNTGAVVLVVKEDSPAFRANVMQGDFLLKIENTVVLNGLHASEIMRSIPAGTRKVNFTVLRNQKKIIIPILLDDEKPLSENKLKPEASNQEPSKQAEKEGKEENAVFNFFNKLTGKK